MITNRLGNVSVLVQSYYSGLTSKGSFGTGTASPICRFNKHLLNDIHVVMIVNYDWLSLLRFGNSRNTFNVV